MSYLLVSDFQNYGHEEKIIRDKDEALRQFEAVKEHAGGQGAQLYKLKLKRSWF